jgi:hypothetical protein
MDNSLIHSYPQMIEAALVQLIDINEQLADAREAIKDREFEAMADAYDARTEDGTKPLNSNDKQREMHVRRYLKEDGEYTRSKSTERILERRKAEMEATAERLRREMRIAVLDYEARVLGHRAA